MRENQHRIPRLHTVKRVAEALEMSERTVRRKIENRELKAHKLGRLVRISEEDLQRYLNERR
jgi:excisionase family DNA binding protein